MAISTPSTSRSRPGNCNTVGTLTAAAGLTNQESGDGIIRCTAITLASATVTMADGTSHLSYGSKEIYTFPTGLIGLMGACFDITALTSVGGATGLNTGAALVLSVGSAVAANDATLTGTEANVLASTAATLTAFAGAAQTASKGTSATTLVGTASTASKVYLNAAAASTETTTTGVDTLTISGVLYFFWYLLGKTGQTF